MDKYVRTHIRIPAELHTKLKDLANKKENRTLNWVITKAIKCYLKLSKEN